MRVSLLVLLVVFPASLVAAQGPEGKPLDQRGAPAKAAAPLPTKKRKAPDLPSTVATRVAKDWYLKDNSKAPASPPKGTPDPLPFTMEIDRSDLHLRHGRAHAVAVVIVSSSQRTFSVGPLHLVRGPIVASVVLDAHGNATLPLPPRESTLSSFWLQAVAARCEAAFTCLQVSPVRELRPRE